MVRIIKMELSVALFLQIDLKRLITEFTIPFLFYFTDYEPRVRNCNSCNTELAVLHVLLYYVGHFAWPTAYYPLYRQRSRRSYFSIMRIKYI